MLDLYCERRGPGLLAEPLNATSNLAFFVAAWAAWRLARRADPDDVGVRGLIGLAIAIGMGSTLFHTFATVWASWLDLIPIFLFQLLFLWLYLRRMAEARRWVGLLSIAAFVAATAAVRRWDAVLNGSLNYAPAFFVLIGLGLDHLRRRPPERFLLLGAAGVFSVALVF
ncbi:MAG: ceramidase domain-containing protein, partial [Thermoleophilia bacterium]|nr:ceramidase domain-containing protein [Thermoleophilia bacterium]